MPSGPRILTNNVFGTVTDNPLTSGATTMNSAGLANLAAVSSAFAVIVLDPERTAGAPEVVFVTAHTGSATSATIARGKYGSSAREHAAGTPWVHAATKEDLIQILTSSTRPSDPYEGDLIYETDTDRYVGYDGSNWQTVAQLGAWTSYTPTLTQSATVTKTVNYAKYVQVGKTVMGGVRLTVTGSGTAANSVVVGLPVTAATSLNISVGVGELFDSSATLLYKAVLILASTTTLFLRATSNTVAGVLGSDAFTAGLASNDVINCSFVYEAA